MCINSAIDIKKPDPVRYRKSASDFLFNPSSIEIAPGWSGKLMMNNM